MLATLRISSDQSKSMSIHLLIADANFDTNFQCCHFEQFIDDLKLQMNMPAAELKCTYVCLWFNECFKKNPRFFMVWCHMLSWSKRVSNYLLLIHHFSLHPKAEQDKYLSWSSFACRDVNWFMKDLLLPNLLFIVECKVDNFNGVEEKIELEYTDGHKWRTAFWQTVLPIKLF